MKDTHDGILRLLDMNLIKTWQNVKAWVYKEAKNRHAQCFVNLELASIKGRLCFHHCWYPLFVGYRNNLHGKPDLALPIITTHSLKHSTFCTQWFTCTFPSLTLHLCKARILLSVLVLGEMWSTNISRHSPLVCCGKEASISSCYF